LLSYEAKKKAKITLSFTSPEKENYYIYIYDVMGKKSKKPCKLLFFTA